MLEREETNLLPQYVYVFFQPNHFVDVHRDMRHGERSQCAEKKNSIFDTRHPNQFVQQGFYDQKDVQQDSENLEIAEKLPICAAKDKSK
jgi:hypothetical protein